LEGTDKTLLVHEIHNITGANVHSLLGVVVRGPLQGKIPLCIICPISHGFLNIHL